MRASLKSTFPHAAAPQSRKTHRGCSARLFLVITLCSTISNTASPFFFPNDPPPPPTPRERTGLSTYLGDLSRRDALLGAVGTAAYGKLVGDALGKLARGDAYPVSHEERVRDTYRLALASAASDAVSQRRPLRVLEVGIGRKCRTVVRNLYSDAVSELIRGGCLTGLELTGVDIEPPNADTVGKARDALRNTLTAEASSMPSSCPEFGATLDVVAGDLSEGLPYPSGFFDAVTCSLTLCSVSDQFESLHEIRRLINPESGSLGYVEHVAVRPEKEGERNRKFLEWQQHVLDPVQQAVADNCHLHRDTDLAVRDVFDIENGNALLLQQERFFVDDMWPISCQCRGVVKRVKFA